MFGVCSSAVDDQSTKAKAKTTGAESAALWPLSLTASRRLKVNVPHDCSESAKAQPTPLRTAAQAGEMQHRATRLSGGWCHCVTV